MRGLIALLAFMLGWMGFGIADATAQDRYGVVTLDLRPDAGEVPTHLCVVSEARSPRTRQTLWDVLEPEPDPATVPGRPGASWRIQSEVWGGLEDAVEAQRCTQAPLGDCRPRVELPRGLSDKSDLFVACTSDSLTEGANDSDPRPLFILLEHLEGSPPQIESVRLTGGVATIGVRANLDHVVVTARSLGGHYQPHHRSERATDEIGTEGTTSGPRSKHVQLGLTPRCRMTEVKLPRVRVRPSDRDRLTVRVHGHDITSERCIENLSGTEVIRVRVPQAPLGVGSIDVELAPVDGKAGARFAGHFEGRWPTNPFALEFNQVTFGWRRPECIYPRDKCPTATLETGTACEASVTDEGCVYRCPGAVTDENAIDLSLPLQVTFEKTHPAQRWTDTLAQNGQLLTSYVPADQIYLNANVNAWETSVPDNKINDVEIFGEDGQARRYGVTHVDNLQLRVPGASCEPVRFRPSGDRHFEDGIATVDDGKINFGDPQRRARMVGFNLTVLAGGGPAWSNADAVIAGSSPDPVTSRGTAPLYFNTLAMLAIQVRPRKPKLNRLAFEGRIGGTLGRWGRRQIEFDEDGDATVNEISDRPLGHARVLFEPGLVFSAHERIAVGAGFGLGFSLPLRQDEELTGQRFQFVYSPNIDFRFRLRSWLRLIVQFRGVFGEKPFLPPDIALGGATLRREDVNAWSLLALFGVQVSF
jgi:hypothetical protein